MDTTIIQCTIIFYFARYTLSQITS